MFDVSYLPFVCDTVCLPFALQCACLLSVFRHAGLPLALQLIPVTGKIRIVPAGDVLFSPLPCALLSLHCRRKSFAEFILYQYKLRERRKQYAACIPRSCFLQVFWSIERTL